MARTLLSIDDELVEKSKLLLKKIGKNAILVRKLEAIIFARKVGITKASEMFEISRSSLTSWAKRLKSGSINNLIRPKTNMNQKISNEQILIIKQWLENNPNMTIKEVRLNVEKQFKITVSQSTIHRIMIKKLDFTHKKPRPKHYKQDPLKVEEYKVKVKKKFKI